jgi:hypothetical protein
MENHIENEWKYDHNCAKCAVINNPHILENYKQFNAYDTIKQSRKFSRILDNNSMQKSHRQCTVIKCDKKRVLFSEIEFITNYATPKSVIVYIHSVVGVYDILQVLFRKLQFECYNKSDFNDEIANSYKNKDILFISDISDDTKIQRKWCKIMEPRMAMFHLSLECNIKFFTGDVHFPLFGDKCCLVTNCNETLRYDEKYINQLSYFNDITSLSYYEHNMQLDNIDGCYNCTAMVKIVEKYAEKFKKKQTATDILEIILNSP